MANPSNGNDACLNQWKWLHVKKIYILALTDLKYLKTIAVNGVLILENFNNLGGESDVILKRQEGFSPKKSTFFTSISSILRDTRLALFL